MGTGISGLKDLGKLAAEKGSEGLGLQGLCGFRGWIQLGGLGPRVQRCLRAFTCDMERYRPILLAGLGEGGGWGYERMEWGKLQRGWASNAPRPEVAAHVALGDAVEMYRTH